MELGSGSRAGDDMRSESGIGAGGHGAGKQKQGRRWHSLRKWKRGSRAGDVAPGSSSRAGRGPCPPAHRSL